MNEKDKPLDFQLWEALKQKCCIKPESANTIVFLGAERFLEAVGPVLKKLRQEARAAAFKDAFAIECGDCASGDEPIHDAQVRWFYHGEGRKQVGCSASKLRLEAAVTNPKHDDGPTNET